MRGQDKTDYVGLAEAYTTAVGSGSIPAVRPTAPQISGAAATGPSRSPQSQNLPFKPAAQSDNNPVNQDEQDKVKKDTGANKSWVTLPFLSIDTPFKAHLAAALIIHFINSITKTKELRDVVYKKIRENNRLYVKHSG
jgi:hypothetical protein